MSRKMILKGGYYWHNLATNEYRKYATARDIDWEQEDEERVLKIEAAFFLKDKYGRYTQQIRWEKVKVIDMCYHYNSRILMENVAALI